MGLDLNKKKLAVGFNLKKISDWFAEKIRFFVFALFVFLAIGCLIVWYQYVYAPTWSEEKKAEYVKSVEREMTFDKTGFLSILNKNVERKKRYEKTFEGVEDIFRLK